MLAHEEFAEEKLVIFIANIEEEIYNFLLSLSWLVVCTLKSPMPHQDWNVTTLSTSYCSKRKFLLIHVLEPWLCSNFGIFTTGTNTTPP
jgi:hypothetical protein